MNLYRWEAQKTKSFESYGSRTLTTFLLLAAAAIVLIALFSKSAIFKSLVLAYVVLP